VSRVLVTGSSGFIGARVLDPLLEAGHEVHAISRRGGRPNCDQVISHRTDLTDAAATESAIRRIEADSLIHLAWYVEHGRYWRSPENFTWIEATLRLLRSFAEAGGRRAVLAGTCAEYEWSRERYDERSSPLVPATLYGVAKHATHLVAERFATDVDLELAWGRIFMPYGPDEPDERLVPSVVRALLRGREAPVSDGRQARDFIYVDDVARAFVAILDSHVGGAINVGSGRRSTIGEMVTLLAEEIGRPELVRWGALPSRPGEPSELIADVGRLREEVGFIPRVDLADGVRRTVSWWRAQALV
jgi:nucleoside-diphosphate-sugar epimerase